MGKLLFAWIGHGSLAAQINRPITGASVDFFAPHGRPVSLTLWRSDGTGLAIHSEMHDIAERTEVGVLQFREVAALGTDATTLDVPAGFGSDVEAFKLLLSEANTIAESGLVFRSSTGDEIVVVPGAYPYSLAISGVLSAPHVFEPEYPLDRYVRVETR